MAPTADIPNFQYFNVSWPVEHVAHVEINRPEKLNTFFQTYVHVLTVTI